MTFVVTFALALFMFVFVGFAAQGQLANDRMQVIVSIFGLVVCLGFLGVMTMLQHYLTAILYKTPTSQPSRASQGQDETS